ncbi:sugar porter family MFS transporter [Thalassotalea litorea]|uniref:D-xylose-proton symporter n=1 Tax=Thalassotalea litorea TaxID=2020715 RepID=A0A5R9IUT8_9GAMM|nr:sugar porter family MFS transporter [Thalassotalea litorea]
MVSQVSATESQENIGFIILISCVATIGGFLFGFDSGVINGTVAGLQKAFNSDSVGTGFNVASMLLGCAVGAFFAAKLADRFGRKSLLVVAATFFIISAYGSGIAATSGQFIVFRIIGGLAVGGASVLAPAYIAEVAPARMRGSLATIQQIAIITGLFLAFVSNYLLAKAAGQSTVEFWLGFEAWRWMFWMELIPACLFLVLLMFIPESPRYLILKQRYVQAEKVLFKLYGAVEGKSHLNTIRDSVQSFDHKPSMADLLDKATGKIRPLVWVGIGLAVFQQFVGINVVFYYGAILWQAVGFTESDALQINMITGAVSIAACIVTVLLIDRIGRKPILLIGSIGMAISLAAMVFSFANADIEANGNLGLGEYGTLALVSANLYVIFFNFSWGPVMWVMLGEMFPNQLRGSGLAIAGLAQWLANFLITISFPIMLSGIGLTGAYGFYTLGAILSAIFVFKYVHETKGKELEEMQA